MKKTKTLLDAAERKEVIKRKASGNIHFQSLKLQKLIICLALFLIGGNALGKEPIVPESTPLNINIPDFEIRVLPCGLKVIFLIDNDMPLVSGNLFIPGGDILDPKGKEGLASLMSATLRDGGVGKLSPGQFDLALENRAVSMSASVDHESFMANFSCLSGDLQETLDLFTDMILRARFNSKRFGSDKLEALDGLHRLEDVPDDLTRVLLMKGLFEESPYGRWASPESLHRITREEVVSFYKRHYGPREAVLVLSGKFDRDKVYGQLENLFLGWKNQEKVPALEEGKSKGPIIYFFPKDVSQVFIRFGVPGIKRHDPDDIPLQVANYILGGSGFTSRLMSQIRSDRGLAYFVESTSVPYNSRGLFEIIGGTRPDSVKEYLDVMFNVIGKFSKEGPSDKELAEAQKSMVEEFAYNFESPYSLAEYKGGLDFHGYPEDYLSKYRDLVKSVSREGALQATNRILSQGDWVMAICGPASIENKLKPYGKVVKVTDIFDPHYDKK